MNFLSPASFLLVFLLPLIVLMYLLKLRRQRQEVSSIFLWERLVRDVEANAPWQKLKRNLIMFFQILFILAMIFALAEPYIFSEGTAGSSIILIIDSSASMSATDTNPSRLEAAKVQAQTFVNEAEEGTRTTLIKAGNTTEILVSSSQDRRQVNQAIDSISPEFGGSDLITALQLTAAITRQQPNTDIYIFSDGKTALPERLNLNGNLFYYPIGIEDFNQGISAIELVQNASGDSNTLFVQLTNYSGDSTTRQMEVFLDGQLYDVASIELNGYTKEEYIRDGISPDIQTIRVSLTDEDFYPLDDKAWVVPANIKPINILLVTNGNRFLEIALDLLPNVTLQTTSLTQFEQGEYENLDIAIFDSYVPPDDLIPQAGLLFIAPPNNSSLFSISGIVEQPILRKIDPLDPVLEGISIGEISIFEARSITLPPWAKMSLAGDTSQGTIPLLLYGKTQGRDIAVISFKLQHTDLPLQVAFPLLIANLVNFLSPDAFDLPVNPLEMDANTVYVPPDIQEVSVTAPNGSLSQFTPEEGGRIVLTGLPPGLYEINWGESNSTVVAVNLFSPQEANIQPATQLDIPASQQDSINSVFNQSKKVFWRPFAILALVLITGEWLIYHRGTLSQLWVTISERSRV